MWFQKKEKYDSMFYLRNDFEILYARKTSGIERFHFIFLWGVMMLMAINSSSKNEKKKKNEKKAPKRKPLVINWKWCSYENNNKSD